jgi:high-affinity iron transporter
VLLLASFALAPLVAAAAAEAGPVSASPADWNAVAAKIDAGVARAVELAKRRESGAAALLQSMDSDVFEASGMEARIGARDAALKAVLEDHLSKLVALAKGAPSGALALEAAAFQSDLHRAAALLAGERSSDPASLFAYALLIVVREGFEAMLIVTAVVAYLVKTGHGDKQRVIGNSVVVAVLASAATAIVLGLAFRGVAASRGVLEGGTLLVAAAVLFSMSYWLISKAEAQKWSAYIKGKVEGSLSSGSMTTLWLASFLAVYREGAETVLFYQALTAGANAAGLIAIGAGFSVGFLALVAVYWGMRAGALRLPVRPFFQATGLLLYVMAFVFAGKGVMELVEGNVFTPTLLRWAPELPALGIYPYTQSLAPQLLLLIAAAISAAVILRRESVRGRGGRIAAPNSAQ